MSPDPSPRRRRTDHAHPHRRAEDRWPPERLDDLKEEFEDLRSEQRAIAVLYRKLDAVPAVFEQYTKGADARFEQYVKTTDARLDRMHTALENLRNENKAAHHNIAYGKDPEDEKKPLPPQKTVPVITWGMVGKFLTGFAGVVALIVVPFLLAGGHP